MSRIKEGRREGRVKIGEGEREEVRRRGRRIQ
jgi:hypothetical protein